MAFNRASFEYIGGGAIGSIWRYVTTDNLSTANAGDEMGYCGGASTDQEDKSGYWNDAFTYYNIRPYDLIIAMNHTSPHCALLVVSAAAASAVTCVFASGNMPKQ